MIIQKALSDCQKNPNDTGGKLNMTGDSEEFYVVEKEPYMIRQKAWSDCQKGSIRYEGKAQYDQAQISVAERAPIP